MNKQFQIVRIIEDDDVTFHAGYVNVLDSGLPWSNCNVALDMAFDYANEHADRHGLTVRRGTDRFGNPSYFLKTSPSVTIWYSLRPLDD